MALIDFLNSEWSISMGVSLSSLVPPRLGYPLARTIADVISSFHASPMVKAVWANQWVLHRGEVTMEQLNHLARETFRSSARSLYEFWHLFRQPQEILNKVDFEPSMIDVINQANRRESGMILVSAHMANFDLAGRAIALRGMSTQILSYPKPPGGYRWQNRIREFPGMHVTPMSPAALRDASQTLRENGVVLTNVDRPLPASSLPEGGAKYRPRFFGRPAAMPVYHIRLALKHNLPIIVLGAQRKPNGKYKVWASEPIIMQRASDLVEETVQNAEAVLNVLGEFIRRSPEQWGMYYPVWPETLDLPPL